VAHLNYKHLRYFWMVARSGSIARASEQLHVTPQSISGQLRELDEALGAKLLRRAGRGLELTDVGRWILSYADEIFGLGDELLDVVRDQASRRMLPFRIGIADSVPKSVAYRVVEPALHLDEPVRLLCREGRLSSLLLPGEEVAIRSRLLQWLESQQLRPRIVGEFDDSALLKAFGQGGAGLFVAPTAIAAYVCRQYGVRALGRIEAVVEQLYAITTERRLRHPATIAMSETAQREVFGAGAGRGARAGRRARRPAP